MIRGLIFALSMAPASAGAIELSLPLDCVLGETCFIQQYMDHDKGPEATDFTCGTLSYDTHSGTDFALPNDAAMWAGVTVRASAPGIVKGARDGMPDIRISDPKAPPMEGRDCGNGVLIEHADGWQTQYCHMKQGSVTVRSGDPIAAGAALGQVGLSGNTEFPHVHLSVRQNGQNIDPFSPDAAMTCGVATGGSLWADPVPYVPGGLISIGIASEVPEFSEIKAGLPDAVLTPTSPALVIWAYYFGNQTGDTIELTLTGPEGKVFHQTAALERTQAQAFRATGKKRTLPSWPAGTYRATVAMIRDGVMIDEQNHELTLR